MLVDLGYDVWMNNSRGNKHSKLHRFLDPKMPEYWDFSFQERGSYDSPALIDFILGKTGVKKLRYMGHSQGTSQMFAGLCTNSFFFK